MISEMGEHIHKFENTDQRSDPPSPLSRQNSEGMRRPLLQPVGGKKERNLFHLCSHPETCQRISFTLIDLNHQIYFTP
jgi:hypothetical protein